MRTFLLTWNPNKWSWDTLDADYSNSRKYGFIDTRWSCGRTMRIRAGDRVFLLRQGKEPRGILASGIVTSDEPFTAPHFAESVRSALYVNARLDILLHPDREAILDRANLNAGNLESVHWDTQSSGIEVPPDAAAELEALWRGFLTQRGYSPIVLADELPSPDRFWEGALRRITVNAFERDPAARAECIAHFGATCRVCGFDFGATYGEVGNGFIHVHHTRPLSDIRAGYAVDPTRDLVPVCPNCHAMLHRSPPLTVEQLQEILRIESAGNRGGIKRPQADSH